MGKCVEKAGLAEYIPFQNSLSKYLAGKGTWLCDQSVGRKKFSSHFMFNSVFRPFIWLWYIQIGDKVIASSPDS